MTTLLVSHPSFLEHDTGPHHPERPDRLRAILSALDDPGFAPLDRREAPPASLEQLTRVHPADYVEAILGVRPAAGEHVQIDGDTVMSHGSAEAVRRAAGAAVAGVDAVMAGQARTAFAAVRPPGHHASPAIPGGFCLFNNVAIAARHAQAVHGIERVAILDFDVHHGQGTQAVVEPDPNLFYASTHQYPLYPGTGSPRERGIAGNVVNVPLAAGTGGSAFRDAWGQRILPALDDFAPELVIISAGFDAHAADPLAGLEVETEDFIWLTEEFLAIAGRHAQGPRRVGPRRRLRPRRAGRIGRHARADPDAELTGPLPAGAAPARLSFRDRAVDLPGRGRHLGLEAQAADDLLQGRVVAPRREGLGAHLDLGGVGDVHAVETAQAEAGLRQRGQQQRAHARLLRGLALHLDGIVGLDVGRGQKLGVHAPHQRPQEDVGGDDETSGHHARPEESGAGEGADHRRAPQRRRRIEAVNVDAFAQDDAGAQEADTGHDLGGDARRIALVDQPGQDHEAAGAQRHQGIGAQPGHLLVPLPLDADGGAQQDGDEEAKGGVGKRSEFGGYRHFDDLSGSSKHWIVSAA